MFEILLNVPLNPTVYKMVISSPDIAAKAQPGQFVIVRAEDDGERIPLTVSDTDRVNGTVTIIYQLVGATTRTMSLLKAGQSLSSLTGPLGRPTELQGLKKVAVIGGGVGCAIAYPIAKKLHNMGCEVHSVVGFRSQDLIILQDEFSSVSDKYIVMTDDGSAGKKGLVTDALKELIESGEQYDEVITIGPLIMMKFVCLLTKQYGIKTVVSMNPIMVDGTGMCGGCRLTVGGKTKFACVDGPDFDGFEVDFDEAIKRSGMYREFEQRKREEHCNLYKDTSD